MVEKLPARLALVVVQSSLDWKDKVLPKQLLIISIHAYWPKFKLFVSMQLKQTHAVTVDGLRSD